MKKIIVTPAGRKKYLEILARHLNHLRSEFDEWHVWLNTVNEDDVCFIKSLPVNYPFVKIKYCDIPVYKTATICRFFRDCIDEDCVYLRLDDDIVYIKEGSISKLFDFRISNSAYFLVYGNILNNAIITHLYQKNGILNHLPPVAFNCEDRNGWLSPIFAEKLHNFFLDDPLRTFSMPNVELSDFQRCSINAISWMGRSFLDFKGEVEVHEETWLSTDKPKSINAPNIIFGDSFFVHYSFHPQVAHLDGTNILDRYRELSLRLK